MSDLNKRTAQKGQQRLPLRRLRQWEAMKFGGFIHFGMSTFDGQELSRGERPSTDYCPRRVDVDQWVSVMRDAGMKYAVLTAKHVSGHCLWPSKLTDYHVGTSGNSKDVVGAFVDACRKRGIVPGFYYCSWDNHHLFGSMTPSMTDWYQAFTTGEYQEFQSGQIRELLTQYGPWGEVWIDIPHVLGRGYRTQLYGEIAALQPDAVIVMNSGISNAAEYPVAKAWPADIITMERTAPYSVTGYQKWREIEGEFYYLPGEVCDTVCHEWFHVEGDRLRSDAELLGMYLSSVSRGANLLLDAGPAKDGRLPAPVVRALLRLQKNITRVGAI